MSFERKQKLREDIKKMRELSRTLINEKKAENEARKERRRENIKRRTENQRKSEVVQVVNIFKSICYLCLKVFLYESNPCFGVFPCDVTICVFGLPRLYHFFNFLNSNCSYGTSFGQDIFIL